MFYIRLSMFHKSVRGKPSSQPSDWFKSSAVERISLSLTSSDERQEALGQCDVLPLQGLQLHATGFAEALLTTQCLYNFWSLSGPWSKPRCNASALQQLHNMKDVVDVGVPHM